MSGPSPTPPEVFVSYSSKDKRYKESLLKQLRILGQQGVISTWHDGLLTPGQQWNEQIVKHIHSSRVILLLISDDFLVSDYVNNVELKLAAERHRAGEVCVIPILVRNVNGWKSQPFGSLKLGDFQALPAGEKFIVEWDNRNKAFTEIAQGIQKAVEQLKVTTVDPVSSSVLRPSPVVDFVARTGRDGRDIVERLKEELSPPSKLLVALIGQGGVGKTILAAEVSRELADVFMGRVVWASAEKRADFTFSTLLDETASQLGDKGLSKLTLTEKETEVCGLIAATPALIILDNFETILTEEQISCADFLAMRAQCSALITSRQRVQGARPIYVDSMKPEEAREFLEKLVEQMQDPTVFSTEVRQRIIETADARPYVMQWVTAQIDLEAQEPNVILEELSQGKGDAAERVFDRSFSLPQLGSDGQDALLALSLFVPSATREALSEVAGFSNDLERTNEAVAKLRALSLIKGTDEYRRLTIEGLTRSLTRARLLKDERADEFRQRFVAHFLSCAEAHAQPTPEDFDSLEAEKDNLLSAIDVAFAMEDWSSVIVIADVMGRPVGQMLSIRGYWEEAIRLGELASAAAQRAGDEQLVAVFAVNAATIRVGRGEYNEAKRAYQQANDAFRKLGDELNLAVVSHQLAVLAQNQGEIEEARRLYNESLEISKRLGNQSGVASGLHNLAVLAEIQGEIEEARRLYNESLEIKRRDGDQNGIALTLHQLAILAQNQGEIEEARRLYNESLEIKRRVGDQNGIGDTLHNLAVLARSQGEVEEARRLYNESLEISKRLGNQSSVAISLHALANLTASQGELSEARRLYEESLEITKKLGDKANIALLSYNMGLLSEVEGDKTEAARLFSEALDIFEQLKSPRTKMVRQDLERLDTEVS